MALGYPKKDDPQLYIDHCAIPLYVLLPGMKAPSVALLKRAVKEIIEYYDEKRAIDRLIQFGVMLKRTTTVSASSKQEIQEELDMYSPYQKFISQNPDVERIAKQKEIEGKTEGKIESKVDSILNILDIRFSNDMLIDLAKQALGHIHDIEILGKLEREALQSPDEQDVHRWLGKYLSQNEKESNREGGEE